MARTPKANDAREGIKKRLREARLLLASPRGQVSRDSFARDELGVPTMRYTQWETRGSDPGLPELAALYGKLPKVKELGIDAHAVAAWVLGNAGPPPWDAVRAGLPADLRREADMHAGRVRALYAQAKAMGLQTPWPTVAQLAKTAENLQAAGDVMGEESIRETVAVLIALRSRVRVGKYVGAEERRLLESDMIEDVGGTPPQ